MAYWNLHASRLKTDKSSLVTRKLRFTSKITRSRENVKIAQELRGATIALHKKVAIFWWDYPSTVDLFFFKWLELVGRSRHVIDRSGWWALVPGKRTVKVAASFTSKRLDTTVNSVIDNTYSYRITCLDDLSTVINMSRQLRAFAVDKERSRGLNIVAFLGFRVPNGWADVTSQMWNAL